MIAEIIQTERSKVRTKGLAVIGMACRFPGARNIDEFWRNLQAGVESTTEFSDEELRRSGIPESVFTSPSYVKHSAILADVDLFDARFFNMSAREAELIDPQQRALLECAWEALEDAGYSSETYQGSVGVYAGSGAPTYLLNLGVDHKAMDPNDATPMLFANTNDLLATRVAYKLNLTGPSITVQTACSTSLVTVHVACRALLNHECDLALAGGVTIRTPQVMGDSFMEGGIVSPDGHCRTFDERAQGTVRSNGVGIVVLKRLEDALRDRDCIHAIIRGSAINNDGSQKVGFAAPSVSGQRDVIQQALRDSGVEPETIRYIEAHGTATPMGDPIEVTALTQAFRDSTAEKGFCAVGSVKSNIGHTDCAAGVAGLIKTVLALEHKQIPATLNFQRPNPMIDFANSPFYVNTTLSEWKTNGVPRRAGVSSFGIGGTNAHAVLEEAPPVESSKETRPYQMLVLSAKTSTALEAATSDLAAYLESHKDVNLADVAYTLQVGRREFSHRRVIVGKDPEDALDSLHSLDVKRVVTGFQEPKSRPVVFMFPGQGAQYVNMAADLYRNELVFKQEVDRCATLLQEHLGLDLRDVLYPKPDEVRTSESATRLLQTQFTQPALFVIEYALAQLWMDWGLQPHAMVGHSIGEYVAACLAGVFSLEDALALVCARGELMQSLPAGSMLVVPLPEAEVTPLLSNNLSLAAVNSPEFSVVSGSDESIERLEQELMAKKLACRRLQTSHAFHSAMMDPILESFAAELRKVHMRAPQLPYMSNLTGTWITEAQATSPDYWVQHLRRTVRFADCVCELVKDPDWVLLEVGPGRTLSTLARWNPYRAQGQVVINSVRHPDDLLEDEAFLLVAAGKLWMTGVQFDWARFYGHEERKRVSLPTYHFERQRYWIEPKKKTASTSAVEASTEKNRNADEWFYMPSWKRTPLTPKADQQSLVGPWLIFFDRFGLGERLKSEAQQRGIEVFSVTEGLQYAQVAESFTISCQKDSDYHSLFKALKQAGKIPSKVLYLWTIADADNNNNGAAQVDLEWSFYGPLFLAQAIGSLANASPVEWVMVSNSLYDVIGESIHHPERATLLGPCHVIPQEYPNVSCRHVDFDFTVREIPLTDAVPGLVEEIVNGSEEKVVAYRKGKRWAQIYEHLHLPANDRNVPLREKGTYLITGGLGGIGLAIAEHLAETLRARLVLVGRSTFPQRKAWEEWLETHPEQDEVSSKIRKLQSLEKMGAEVLVVSADVSDEQQIRSAIAYAQECFGPLNGVMHCAGVPGGGVIQLKTREIAEAVLAPKVKGTMVLASVLNKTPLDFFVACSSRTSITGSFGQVDYCAANAFQDAFAHFSRQNGSPAMVAINWDAWANVGMLASAAIPGAKQAEPVSQETGEKVDHPFFDVRIVESPDREVYVTTMSPLTHWILDEHRIAGNPIIPGTAYLEMVRAAVEKYANGRDIEIQDVFFLAPLGLREDETREVRLILEKQNAGYTFRIVSQVSEDNGAETHWNDYSTGAVAFIEPKRIKRQDLAIIKRRCNLQQVAFTDESKRDEDLGPRWQTLKQAYVGDHELLAVFELPDQFTGDFEKLKMHPSLLDRSMEIGKHFLFPVGVYLPMGYRRLTIKQPLGKRIYTHVVFDPTKRQDGETMLCDVTIFDEQGVQLLKIDSFSQKRVNDIAAQIKAVAKKQYHSNRSEPSAKDAALASVYAEAMEQGLSVREGLEALRRILQLKSEPQVIVSTNDLQTMILQAGSLRPMAEMLAQAAEAPVASGSRHPRPAIVTPYQAPGTPVERQIAEIWQKILGIDEIGIHDNYFELSGDSVQAIQIVSQMNQQGFQLTPQQLFQHLTIAELAVAITTSETPGAEQEKTTLITSAPSASDDCSEVPASDFSLAGLDEQELRDLELTLAQADHQLSETANGQPGTFQNSVEFDITRSGNGSGFSAQLEEMLRQHPAVSEVLVAETPNAPDETTAYVVLRSTDSTSAERPMQFGLFYFGDDNSISGSDKYRLYLEGAKFADRHGFSSVWTPERHFHRKGGLYPNPSVLNAALAIATERVQLRAGSVVMPLHNPLRVAEEWSIVDNLSRGRVGIAFVSGWVANDFAFFPERFAHKRDEMLKGIAEVQRLWRGEKIDTRDGAGNMTQIEIFPKPIQPELPISLTCSGGQEMFVKAGELGFGILTSLQEQSTDEVAAKIKAYQEARTAAGFDPATGQVTMMIHTFMGSDKDTVLQKVRGPLSNYLRSHVDLIKSSAAHKTEFGNNASNAELVDSLVAFAFERYYRNSSLIGTPESCLPMIERLKSIGVSEVACLIDFGVDVESSLESLRSVNLLRQLCGTANISDRHASLQEDLMVFLRAKLSAAAIPNSLLIVDELPAREHWSGVA